MSSMAAASAARLSRPLAARAAARRARARRGRARRAGARGAAAEALSSAGLPAEVSAAAAAAAAVAEPLLDAARGAAPGLAERAAGAWVAFGALSGQEQLRLSALAAAAVGYLVVLKPNIALGFLDAYLAAPLDYLLERARGLSEERLVLQGRLGQGSFGTVYAGCELRPGRVPEGASARVTEDDPAVSRRVIIKQGSTTKLGAAELAEVEIWMNRRVRRSMTLSRYCAPFLGAFEGEGGGSGYARDATVLVWQYEGERTLESFLLEPTFPLNLEEPLFGREGSGSEEARELRVISTVLYQVLEAIAALHAAGIVHRDIKPANLVLAERTRRFKVIDLGGACDLRVGKNYEPDLAILDPNYAPPERTVMPEVTPVPPPAPVAALLSPALWLFNRPHLFDTYSVGMLLMRMSVPGLRSAGSLANFNASLETQADLSLRAWRNGGFGSSKLDYTLLDADRGAGFDLACQLVAPRGSVLNRFGRASAKEALLHRFFRFGPLKSL